MYFMHPSIEEFGEWVWSHVSHMHDTWHGGIWYHYYYGICSYNN